MGRQGDSLRRLTSFGSHPSWAPDGLSIVFCVDGQDLPLERTPSDQLWVVDVATTTTRRIEGAFADVMHPRWSPDNTRIARGWCQWCWRRCSSMASTPIGQPR